MLNRIYFNSTDINDIIMYSYKILAEKLQLISEHQLSAAFSIAYVSLKEEQKSYKNENNLEKRSLYLGIQETFILFHELAHNNLRLDGEESSQAIQEIREVILELFELNEPNEQDEQSNALEMFENIARVFGENIDENRKKDDVKNILKIMDNKRFEDELYNIIGSKDYIIEEIICDNIAFDNTLKYYNKFSTDVSQDDVVAAVYIGILHLELISLIDNMAINRFKDKNLSDINTFKECIIRKKAIIKLFCLSSNVKINLDSIIQINNRYSKIIKDPVLFKLDLNILNFEKGYINDLFKDMNQFEITACIDKILDFKNNKILDI